MFLCLIKTIEQSECQEVRGRLFMDCISFCRIKLQSLSCIARLSVTVPPICIRDLSDVTLAVEGNNKMISYSLQNGGINNLKQMQNPSNSITPA